MSYETWPLLAASTSCSRAARSIHAISLFKECWRFSIKVCKASNTSWENRICNPTMVFSSSWSHYEPDIVPRQAIEAAFLPRLKIEGLSTTFSARLISFHHALPFFEHKAGLTVQ